VNLRIDISDLDGRVRMGRTYKFGTDVYNLDGHLRFGRTYKTRTDI
jgi:hypothetical protein